MQKLTGFLRLMRPANIVTALADVLAGFSIAGIFFSSSFLTPDFFFLLLSTIGLYGGGVVLNDVFDADLDSVERPERPIPSGLVSRREGAVLGIFLLMVGVGSALYSGLFSGGIAFLIALAAVVYDRWGKHHVVFGPLNMGLCRGLNLLLGISLVPAMAFQYGYLMLTPMAYIAAITLISQGEVHGGKKTSVYTAIFLYGLVMTYILLTGKIKDHFWITGGFVLMWAAMVFVPLMKALQEPIGKNVGKAVKAGVLGLILMDAAWASAFATFHEALIIALLLPLSLLLARVFAVT